MMHVLKPVSMNSTGVHELPRHTATLAQRFIDSPAKRWLEDHPMRLKMTVPPNEKLLLWARMMLVNPEDREYLKKADIFRGVFASLYQCYIDPSLVAAFLTYWNVDGHTLITSKGEMGYPLHTMYDAMGIPISGRLYEEFIPAPSTFHGYVQTLHSIYIDVCPLKLKKGPGLVTVAAWVNHFFGIEHAPSQSFSFLPDCLADHSDPLYEDLGFRVEIRDGRPAAIMHGQEISYTNTYPLVVYRAAFIAAWLCTYCVPTEEGHYVRPEVFTMAVEIAQGSRRAIGVTSMALLYRTLDNVYHHVVAQKASASDCSLFVPAHFLMGWFASFWNEAPRTISLAGLVRDPPFIMDFRNYESMDIKSAHNLFWDFNEDSSSLRSLDFLGRSSIRFLTSNQEIEIIDDRTSHAHWRISIAAVDFLVSCTVGGVTYRRGENFDNQVYCPHRFARMFNYDQHVPNCLMITDKRTRSLDFPRYLRSNSKEESLQLLQRRHLAYFRPRGHSLSIQPFARASRCSLEYIKWYSEAFKFLKHPSSFCSRLKGSNKIKIASRKDAPGTKISGDSGANKSTPVQRRKTAKSASTPPKHQEKSPHAAVVKTKSSSSAASLKHGELAMIESSRPGKNICKVRACIDNFDSVTGRAPSNASQEPLGSSPPEGTKPNLQAAMSTDPLDEGLAIPTDDIISTLPANFIARELPDLSDNFDGVINSEVNLHLDSPTSQNAIKKDHVESYIHKSDKPCDAVNPTAQAGETVQRATPTEVERFSSESKQLFTDIEQIIAQVSQSPNMNSGSGESFQLNEFNGDSTVTLPKLSDAVSARYIKHIWYDVSAFQDLLKKRPIQKDVVLREISLSLNLWGNFFLEPPPEIGRLMKGLQMLHRALSEEAHLSDTDLIPTQQDQVNQHVATLRTAQDKVKSSCVTLDAITSGYKKEHMAEECTKRVCMQQAQAIKQEISGLRAKLQQVEDAYSCAQHRQDAITEYLNSHLERSRQAKNRESEIAVHLEQASTHQKNFQDITDLTKHDEFGLSKYIYNLFDFFMGCSFE
uniref:Aminotransferase-like plant mobile domain-containing protein n=1 Tax=Oryza punctata TaxID=4537 RepID=A0A0E0LWN0_ORYPU